MRMTVPEFVPLDFVRLDESEMVARARDFYGLMRRRRSVRSLSSEPVPRECVEYAVRTAASAPSGANRQPWRFVIVDDTRLKREIRVAAEAEERENYKRRFPPDWLEALSVLGTDWHKPFLEDAPYLVVVFKQSYGVAETGSRVTNYYVNESVGIACGLFIAALHTMGLATLTHTPSPMGFLARLLKRPSNEKPYILFPVGYPAADATVPVIARKNIEDVVQWNQGTGS
ncbi:MAG: nitroreductase family protein [Gemmatimonadota bacterium]|nr:MAG: nitroreductase family protein [Gemmatimonadota bacterium]